MNLVKLHNTWLENLRKYPERKTVGSLGFGDSKNYTACCLGEIHLCAHRLKKQKLPFNKSHSIIDQYAGNIGVLFESYGKYGFYGSEGKFDFYEAREYGFETSTGGSVRMYYDEEIEAILPKPPMRAPQALYLSSLSGLNDEGSKLANNNEDQGLIPWPVIADFIETYPKIIFRTSHLRLAPETLRAIEKHSSWDLENTLKDIEHIKTVITCLRIENSKITYGNEESKQVIKWNEKAITELIDFIGFLS